jgi:hypothetical protein
MISSPAVVDGRVYVGTMGTYGGKVYCLNATTGTHIWNYTTGSSIESSPAVVDGKVYAGSDTNGEVYCFGLPVSSPTSLAPTSTQTPSASPSSFTATPPQSPSLSSAPSLNASSLEANAWIPTPENAVVATAVAAIAAGITSVAVAAAITPVGAPTNKVTAKVRDLLPSTVKKWIGDFVKSKRKLAVGEKTGSRFVPTKSESIAYAITIAALPFSFSYVKVDNLINILRVLPLVLATSIFFELAKSYTLIAFSRTRGVWTEFKLMVFWVSHFPNLNIRVSNPLFVA